MGERERESEKTRTLRRALRLSRLSRWERAFFPPQRIQTLLAAAAPPPNQPPSPAAGAAAAAGAAGAAAAAAGAGGATTLTAAGAGAAAGFAAAAAGFAAAAAAAVVVPSAAAGFLWNHDETPVAGLGSSFFLNQLRILSLPVEERTMNRAKMTPVGGEREKERGGG